MNDTVSWLASAFDKLDAFLATPGPLRAVLFGLLLSWGGTQMAKFSPRLRCMALVDHRLATRLLAFALAYVPVAWLWPGPWSVRLLAAVTTGLCAPMAYTIAVRAAYHFWPWLEPRLSARPSEPPRD